MDRSLIKSLTGDFEAHAADVDGVECWFARDLQHLLGYVQWRNFLLVVDKAKMSCQPAGNSIDDHFADVSKMVTIEHVKSNRTVRKALGESGIKPEELPPEEDIRKLERRINTADKKSLERVGKLKKGPSKR